MIQNPPDFLTRAAAVYKRVTRFEPFPEQYEHFQNLNGINIGVVPSHRNKLTTLRAEEQDHRDVEIKEKFNADRLEDLSLCHTDVLR